MSTTKTTEATDAVEVGNYDFLARKTAGQRLSMSALLAAPLPLGRTDSADTESLARLEHGKPPLTWEEYDRLLCLFDLGLIEVEPKGPHANLDQEHRCPAPDTRDDDTSERTARRHRGDRKREVQALLARDGRITVESAVERVAARRSCDGDCWLKVCDACAQPFEATRDDARFCSDACRKRSRRRSS